MGRASPLQSCWLGSFLFLERLVVERLQTFTDSFIELRQTQELAVPQSRQNEAGDDIYGTFHRSLVLGRIAEAW